MSAAQEQTTQEQNSITVIGRGTAAVAPDAVQVTLSVQSVEPDLAGALARLLEAMSGLTAVLEAHHVPDTDRQTTGFSLEPHWDPKAGEVQGFEGRQGVRVQLARVDQLGPLVTAAVQAAGDRLQVGQIELVVNDPSAAARRARSAALADAKAKAAQWADECGRILGRVLQLSEVGAAGGAQPLPRGRMKLAMDAAASIEPGSSTLDAALAVEFALD